MEQKKTRSKKITQFGIHLAKSIIWSSLLKCRHLSFYAQNRSFWSCTSQFPNFDKCIFRRKDLQRFCSRFFIRLILLLQNVNRITLARIDLMPLIRCANVLVKNEFIKAEGDATWMLGTLMLKIEQKIWQEIMNASSDKVKINFVSVMNGSRSIDAVDDEEVLQENAIWFKHTANLAENMRFKNKVLIFLTNSGWRWNFPQISWTLAFGSRCMRHINSMNTFDQF